APGLLAVPGVMQQDALPDPRQHGVAPAATSGPVPHRVKALLAAPHVTRRAATRIAALLMACAAVSFAASATGMIDFHHRVEVAQGDTSR
ncbi:hypothetical protein ACWDAO_29745, partial [Streptomyces sp. NPDC001212]